MATKRPRYQAPVTYTAEQLRAAEIADLETDVRCAVRDGQPEYAEECRQKLARLRAPNLDAFARAYLQAALWSSNDESDESGGDPLDKNYDIDDIAPESIVKAVADCAKFVAENTADLQAAFEHAASHGDEHSGDPRNGHDFWLTRNRHGVGFWDRDYPKALGQRLTDAAHAFGEVNPYVGDDGKVYL